jgi:hypothetical protein
MASARAGSLLAQLSQVPDPRGRNGRRHSLGALLTAVVCGVLCGNYGYAALVEWLHDQSVDVWHWMGFTRKPPKLDCFRDLLMRLDPTALEAAVRRWTTEDLGLSDDDETLKSISLDGKTLCGTLRPFAAAVHLLAAVDHQTGCVLSQCRVDEKTNEYKAALHLLQTMVLKGTVVVGDAMFCQRELCRQVVESGGDYFLSVKANQPDLLREIELEFAADDAAFSPLGSASAAV